MSAIEAVVFDFGNVLTMVDRLACAAALARHSPLDAPSVEACIWGGQIERLSETGALDSREHYERVRAAIRAADSLTYERFLGEFVQGFELNPEGVAAMRLASESGRRVFVLSNTSYNHARFLFDREVLVRIPEGHVLSFKVGAMKPDPAIWRHLLRSHCLQAERCVYVDDIAAFCAAAGTLGFRTIHYTRGRTDLAGELARLLAD